MPGVNRREFLKTATLTLSAGVLGAATAVKAFQQYFPEANVETQSNSAAPNKAIQPGTPRYYFVIFVDGLWPGYIERFQPPNIMRLISEGTYFPNAYVGNLTGNTIVSHQSMNAGLYPKRWGIVDYGWRNTYDDPALAKVVPKNKAIDPGNYDLIVKEDLAGKIRRQYEARLPSFARWVKTRYPDALTAGVASKRYLATYLTHMDIRLMGRYTENNTIEPYYQLGKAEGLLNDLVIDRKDELKKLDDWVMEAATRIVSNLMPRYMLINLPLVDLNAHVNGGPETLDQMYPIVMNADRLIGEFVETLKTLGIYDKSVIVITADHGFATGHEHIFPQKVKAELEAIGIKVDLARGGEGYMTFWLGDPDFKDNQKKRKVAEYLASVLPNADAIFYKATFDVGGREVMQYVPVKDSGSPVYVKLLNTALAPQGPDVVAFFGDYTNAYDSETIVAGHGGAGWMVQNIPIIIRGPGVPRGLVVETMPYSGPRIVDIAPTLVALTDPSDEYIGEFDGRPIFSAGRQQTSTSTSLASASAAKLLERERL